MRSTWWTRYIHIHRVSKGVCPCCEGKGEYSMREFPHHFWLYFQCKSCGYELREHVSREKEEGTMPEEKRVLLMLNDIDEGPNSIGHISVPESKVEEFQKVLRYRDIGTMRVSVEELNSVEELSCYFEEKGPSDAHCGEAGEHVCRSCAHYAQYPHGRCDTCDYRSDEGAGHDMDRCNKHHMHGCPDCHPMPEDRDDPVG